MSHWSPWSRHRSPDSCSTHSPGSVSPLLPFLLLLALSASHALCVSADVYGAWESSGWEQTHPLLQEPPARVPCVSRLRLCSVPSDTCSWLTTLRLLFSGVSCPQQSWFPSFLSHFFFAFWCIPIGVFQAPHHFLLQDCSGLLNTVMMASRRRMALGARRPLRGLVRTSGCAWALRGGHMHIGTLFLACSVTLGNYFSFLDLSLLVR